METMMRKMMSPRFNSKQSPRRKSKSLQKPLLILRSKRRRRRTES